MARCPSCSTEIPEHSRFCSTCGAALGSASQASTVAMPPLRTPAPSSFLDEGRFPAGTLLANRYRIIGLVGQGGMGEVYRANDLKLGQPVALKFLPAATGKNEQSLDRFHAEVRIARRVSHPNVCRVYDIGEVDGSTFLSMEYVDGEDLRSLLRRIGRLPPDKAVEIARKLCAGLAASHDKGVLHRDLKPANIMIDGRGQVLIMDFGVAALAGELDGAQLRGGTPAYMAPEQLAGKEVSVRSDIYALGLVLHEMFTGKRAFEDGSQRTTPTVLSSLAKDTDPLVERVILRCLDLDPHKRPVSALAVAAALPGGDPLQAALAAGETPTPGMVAASGDTQGISVRTAGICLAWILAGCVAAVILAEKANILQRTPFPHSSEILAQKADEMIQSFGYTSPFADRAYHFSFDTAYQTYAEKGEKPAAYRDQLATGQPPLIHFWYRQSPEPLIVKSPFSYVSPDDPPPIVSGMIGLSLDPQGRLLQLDAVPPQIEQNPSAPAPFDWKALFTAAGLELTRFTPAEPQWISLAPFDARAAWTGSYASAPGIPIHLEAASWHGRPVFFRLIGPWSKPERMRQFSESPSGRPVFAWVVYVALAVAVFLAWRNFRAKRGDIRGANRVAAFVFTSALLQGMLSAHHVALSSELEVLILRALGAATPAAIMWAVYLAFEPYVRRRWPQSMITWSRVLSGGFRDPLVGGHLLIGMALGIGFALLNSGARLAQGVSGLNRDSIVLSTLEARGLASILLTELIWAILYGMLLTLILMLLRVVLRRQWLAAATLVLLGASTAMGETHPGIMLVFQVSSLTLLAATLLRFGGLVPTIACIIVGNTLDDVPIADFSTWYASTTVFVLIAILALTAYAFHTAVARRPLFKAGFLEPD
jgi:predicted Ser/Thr protein kinase